MLIDAANATMAVVFGNNSLILVDIDGLSPETKAGLGHSVPLERLGLNRPRTIGTREDREVLAVADLLVSAQLLGIAEATRDLAVSYAKIRNQFGRPIGSFQAVKHHCANMALAAEAVSSMLDMAAIALRDGREDAGFQLAALRLLAPKAALGNARTCIQVHGGIGFSAEASPHHYLKRAHVLRQFVSGTEMLDLPAPLASLRHA
jgi:alkylation response protein AidB-like acyl-CoA dehydrogenase